MTWAGQPAALSNSSPGFYLAGCEMMWPRPPVTEGGKRLPCEADPTSPAHQVFLRAASLQGSQLEEKGYGIRMSHAQEWERDLSGDTAQNLPAFWGQPSIAVITPDPS